MRVSKFSSVVLLVLATLPLTAVAEDEGEFAGTRVRATSLLAGGELQIHETTKETRNEWNEEDLETSDGAGALTLKVQFSNLKVEPTSAGQHAHEIRDDIVSAVAALGGTLPDYEGDDGETHAGAEARIRATLLAAYFGSLPEEGGCRPYTELTGKGEARYRVNPMLKNEVLGAIALAPLGLFCARDGFVAKIAPEGEALAKSDETFGYGVGGRLRIGSENFFLEIEGGSRRLERDGAESRSNWGQGSVNARVFDNSAFTLSLFVAGNHDKKSVIETNESGTETVTKHDVGAAFGGALGATF